MLSLAGLEAPQKHAITVNDWLSMLELSATSGNAEFDLGDLQSGDLLLIVTAHTRYEMVSISGREAQLRTDRPDRPSGKVKITGCTFGRSSTIKPSQIFCGGNLEFTFDEDRMTHLTTAIREIHWLRRKAGHSAEV